MGSLERILTYGNKADVYTNEEKVRLANEKNKAYVDLVSKITKEDVLPNILSLLQSLRNKNIKIGLASASENAFEVIDRLGIRHYFDYIADATKIPNSKPAPDVFLDVMHGFGFESTECIGIEDAQAGIEAIKAANMFAVGIGKKSELIGADIIFENTEKMTFDLVVNQWLKGQN
jgi:beta-phosphoglucomutase